MTHKDKAKFYLMLDSLAEVFDVELSDSRKEAYAVSLQDIPLRQMTDAFTQAVRTAKYFPVPAVLRELAGYATGYTDPAEAAWIKLRNLETRYNRDALTDPLTREVFEAMGGGYVLSWGFGNWPLEQEDRKRREFMTRYQEAQHARAMGRTPQALHVLHEVEELV
jgi:hypothetical protein